MRIFCNILGIVLVIFSIMLTSNELVGDERNSSQVQAIGKLYITPDDLKIEGNDITVRINEHWVQTKAVYSDDEGIYIRAGSILDPWVCSSCGVGNPPWRFVCQYCKSPR